MVKKQNSASKDKIGPDGAAMTPEAFRAWRKGLGLKQKDAADRLGLKKRMIQYYEKGDRDGKKVEIPKAIRLACYAVARGVEDFDGADAAMVKASPAPDSAGSAHDGRRQASAERHSTPGPRAGQDQ